MSKYNRFYEQFIEKLKKNITSFPLEFVVPNHQNNKAYLGYNTGKSGIKFYTEYTSKGYSQGYTGFIVGVYLDGPRYESRLHKLSQHRSNIESSIGDKLNWIDTGRAGRIFYILREDIKNEKQWHYIIDWEIQKLIKIIHTFQPYIDDL